MDTVKAGQPLIEIMKLLLIALGLGAACAQFAVPLVRVESGREYLTRIGRTDLITNRPYVLSTTGTSVLSDYMDVRTA